ncbi:MAG: hypothetical protein P4L40_25430, partial [Terracidiphilus sp.]|nr:hypothetical protein [Terracidiphilus sp.]
MHELRAALVGNAPYLRLPYVTLVRHLFVDDTQRPTTAGNQRRARLLAVVEQSMAENVGNHPYLYNSEADLLSWSALPAPIGGDATLPTSVTGGVETLDTGHRVLTGAGVAIAVEAWCQDSHVHVTQYTDEEHARLRFWRCHGTHIVQQVFRSSSDAVRASDFAPSTLPWHLRQPPSPTSLLPLRMSDLHFRDSLRLYEQVHGRAFSANRPRYAYFSRIQAYGLSIDPITGKPAAFFLPPLQIVSHMLNFFRSSSAFELPKASRNPAAYVQKTKFGCVMLMNVCG